MRRKRIVVFLSVILILAALAPVVYAYMFHRSQTVSNVFVPAHVDCKVSETFNGSQKTEIKVANTSNVTAYVRLILVCNWQDSKGNPVVRNADPPTFDLGDMWVERNGIYYYKEALAAETGVTTDLVATAITRPEPTMETIVHEDPKTHESITTEYWYYPVIEVIAEAIQADPQNAVEESWNVTINNGMIVPER